MIGVYTICINKDTFGSLDLFNLTRLYMKCWTFFWENSVFHRFNVFCVLCNLLQIHANNLQHLLQLNYTNYTTNTFPMVSN